jgi:hypothetical protein
MYASSNWKVGGSSKATLVDGLLQLEIEVESIDRAVSFLRD